MDMNRAWEIVNLSKRAFDEARKTVEDEGLEWNGWGVRLREAVWGKEYKEKTSFNTADNLKDQFGAWRQEVIDEFREIDGIRTNVTIRFAGDGSTKATEMCIEAKGRDRRIWSRRGEGFFLDGPWWSDVERIANGAADRANEEIERMRAEREERRSRERREERNLISAWNARAFKDIAN